MNARRLLLAPNQLRHGKTRSRSRTPIPAGAASGWNNSLTLIRVSTFDNQPVDTFLASSISEKPHTVGVAFRGIARPQSSVSQGAVVVVGKVAKPSNMMIQNVAYLAQLPRRCLSHRRIQVRSSEDPLPSRTSLQWQRRCLRRSPRVSSWRGRRRLSLQRRRPFRRAVNGGADWRRGGGVCHSDVQVICAADQGDRAS